MEATRQYLAHGWARDDPSKHSNLGPVALDRIILISQLLFPGSVVADQFGSATWFALCQI